VSECADKLAAVKAAERKAAYGRRKAAKAAGGDETACANLVSFLGVPKGPGGLKGRIISGYLPIRTEINPRAAMAALCRDNRLCVPVIAGAGKPLQFRAWTPDAALKEGPFGAMVPQAGAWLEPEVLIVPLLAYDARGYRLGYGGGFYDRTLEGLRARGRVLAVGFAYSAQQVDEVPIEPTDQKLDALVSERGLLRF